jgi:DNA-directed RNA polymerase subunit RPC12/RpoP
VSHYLFGVRMPFCPDCGYKIPDDHPFCGKCGAAAVDPSSGEDQVAKCEVCGGRLRAGRLYSGDELTVVMSDAEEERFIEALVCGACGRTQLIVDFETDIEP